MRKSVLYYIYIVWAIGMSFSCTFAYDAIGVTGSTSPSQECEETKNLAHYKGQSVSYGVFVKDANSFNRYLNNHPIQNGEPVNETQYPQYISKIHLWNPYGILSQTPDTYDSNQSISPFFYISNVKPAGVAKVKFARQFSAMYITTGGVNRSGSYAQIHMEISKQQISSISPQEDSSYKRFDENNNINRRKFKINNAFNPSPKDTICMNFYVAKCGDGVLDNPNQTGTNNTDGKQGIQTSNGFVAWVNSGFNGEVCDSTTSGGVACINGTPGCCNLTCSDFGSGGGGDGGYCGNGIVDDGEIQAPPTNILDTLDSFFRGILDDAFSVNIEGVEDCDEGLPYIDEDTGEYMGNGFGYCGETCKNLTNISPEISPDELIDN